MEPRSRAAARRNDLDTDQRRPTIRRREGAEACLLNPASAAPETLDTPASSNVALSQEAVCVATTSRIRRTLTATCAIRIRGWLRQVERPRREDLFSSSPDRCGPDFLRGGRQGVQRKTHTEMPRDAFL